MTSVRNELIETCRWHAQNGWVLLKWREENTRRASFKWARSLPQVSDLTDVLVLKRFWRNEGEFKLQPIKEEHDLEFVLKKNKQHSIWATEEEEGKLKQVLTKLHKVCDPWVDALDGMENFLNNYRPPAQDLEENNGFFQVEY